jgi:hypothetical protein
MFDMRRREFITLLGGAVAAWPLVGRAQKGPVPVIGTLYGVSAANWAKQFAGFHRGLSEAGFVEGRNVALDYRWGEPRPDCSDSRQFHKHRCSSIGAGADPGRVHYLRQCQSR